MNGIVAIIGLTLVAIGAGFYSLPAGLIVFGLGLYLDSLLPRGRGPRKER